MRTLLLVLCLVATPAWAGNDRLVVMSSSDRAMELESALEVALAGRGVAVTSRPAPFGALRLDRAASAQRAAVELQADAAVWIDEERGAPEVCAVSADGRQFRHAPLPPDDSSPRVFAAIAASLVDELIAPPEPAVAVNVHVDVNGASDGAAAPAVDAAAEPPDPKRWQRTMLEGGLAAGTFALAAEGSLLFPVSPHWRLGVSLLFGVPFMSSVSWVPEGSTVSGDPVAGATAEVRRSGHGYRHWAIGGFAGAMTALGDGVFVSGMRIGHVWEGKHLSSQIALSPTLIVADRGDDFGVAAWLSFRVGLAL
jgi:hypothetical protein